MPPHCGGMADSFTVYSHDWPERSSPPPADRQAAAAFLDTLRRNPPGVWSDNRWNQVNHYRGVIYVAVREIMSLFFGATYTAVRRRRNRRNRTTFGPGVFVKSTSAASRQGRDEDYVPIDDDEHPLHRLVRRPNPTETLGRLTAKGVLQYLLTGVMPVWRVPNRSGRPVQLWALRTPYLYPTLAMTLQYPNGAWRVTAAGVAAWQSYLPWGGAGGAVLPGEEVVRLLNPHPIVDYDGFSPLNAAGVQLDVLESIDESRKSAMDNGLQLDAVLMLPGLSEQDIDRLQQTFTQKMAGSNNARRLSVVSFPAGMGDKGELKPFGTSPRDMDYSQGWEQMVKFTLSLFGVPPAVAGLVEAGSYSQLFASRRQFHDRQAGTFGEVEDFYTRHCAEPFASDDFPDEYAVQVRPKPLDDHELREQQIKRMLDKDLVTYNEARVMDDHDPVPDGDVPVSLYLKQLEQKLMPQQPAPGMPGEGGEPDAGGEGGGEGGGDALAALLGGDATPTGGGPPGEDNPAAEGTRAPVEQITKAVRKACLREEWRILKAGEARKPGEVWESPNKPGRWFTLKNGRVVPAKNPNAKPPAPKAPRGPTKKEQKREARTAADKAKADGRARVAEVATKLRDGGAVTHEDAKALDENLKHLSVDELKQLNRVIGSKVSVAKAKLIDQAIRHAKSLAAGGGGKGAGGENAPDLSGAKFSPVGSDTANAGKVGKLTAADGTEYFFKGDAASAVNDVAAAAVGRAMGVPVPAAWKVSGLGQVPGGGGVVTEWVGGKSLKDATPAEKAALKGKAELRPHLLFNYLVGDPDRSAGNMMLTPGGSVAHIDHELAFPGEGYDDGFGPAEEFDAIFETNDLAGLYVGNQKRPDSHMIAVTPDEMAGVKFDRGEVRRAAAAVPGAIEAARRAGVSEVGLHQLRVRGEALKRLAKSPNPTLAALRRHAAKLDGMAGQPSKPAPAAVAPAAVEDPEDFDISRTRG